MSPRLSENPNVFVKLRKRSIAIVPNCLLVKRFARRMFRCNRIPSSLVSAVPLIIKTLHGHHWPTMVANLWLPVKRMICEGRWTAVECGSDHDKRRKNWNQSICRTEEGFASNRHEGRQKPCPAVRDFAKRCCSIVQGRRACISSASSLPPEERALRIVPLHPDIDQLAGCGSEIKVPSQKLNFEMY